MIDGLPQPDWQSPCGDYALYHGDCLEILPKLPDGCVDAVVTDPPFTTAGGSSNGMQFDADDQFFRHWLSGVIPQVCRCCSPSGSQFWFCDWKTIGVLRSVFATIGRTRKTSWRLTQALYWLRDHIGMGSPFRNCVEMIGFVRGPSFKWDGPTDLPTAINHRWVYGSHPHHAAEKPQDLLAEIVKWSSFGVYAEPDGNPNILDPFTGSGTTGVACVKTGRKFIGVELEKTYFDIAVERIEKALNDAPLLQEASK